MKPHPRRNRHISMTAVCVALGLTLNVASAWAPGANWGSVGGRGYVPETSWPFPVSEGLVAQNCSCCNGWTWDCHYAVLRSKWEQSPVGGIKVGWPFRSFAAWRHLAGRASELDEHGYLLSSGADLVPRFPSYPLWPGFVFNTILFSITAWGLWQVPLAIRRRERRRAGRCMRCGYDLAGLAVGAVCPECGSGGVPS